MFHFFVCFPNGMFLFMFFGSFFDEVSVMPVVRTGIILSNLSELTLLKPGVNLIKLLQV